MTHKSNRLFDPATRAFDHSVIENLAVGIQDDQYAPDYEYVSGILLQTDPQTSDPYIAADLSVHQTQLFFDGAAEANEGSGVFSAWIRTYTQAQGVLRKAHSFSPTEMQAASDAVAASILTDLTTNNILPTIQDIADFDALNIGDVLFPELSDDNPAWSGVVLYQYFGSDETDRLDDGTILGTVRNYAFAALSSDFATLASLGELTVGPVEFFQEDASTLGGVVDLWWTHAELSDVGALLLPGLVPAPSFGGTPITIEEVFDPSDLEAVTPRVQLGAGGTITGTGEFDILYGSPQEDLLVGDGGADLIIAGAGNDTIEGGEGDDVATGSLGHDDLFGNAGSNVLHGGQGADVLVGGAGGDT